MANDADEWRRRSGDLLRLCSLRRLRVRRRLRVWRWPDRSSSELELLLRLELRRLLFLGGRFANPANSAWRPAVKSEASCFKASFASFAPFCASFCASFFSFACLFASASASLFSSFALRAAADFSFAFSFSSSFSLFISFRDCKFSQNTLPACSAACASSSPATNTSSMPSWLALVTGTTLKCDGCSEITLKLCNPPPRR